MVKKASTNGGKVAVGDQISINLYSIFAPPPKKSRGK